MESLKLRLVSATASFWETISKLLMHELDAVTKFYQSVKYGGRVGGGILKVM